MTSSGNGTAHSSNYLDHAKQRRKLRDATLILPNGRRIRRNITFGPGSPMVHSDSDGEPQEGSPLLGSGSASKRDDGLVKRNTSKLRKWTIQGWKFANSRTGRGVFKCSIAYLLGSLATFIPQISAVLGQQDGKHMVATVTVYFHPARSIGSMFEAMLCAVVAFVYAVFISFSSMGISMFFGDYLGKIAVGHIIVLIVFCGGGLGFVGWIKQHLSNPLVNISCSLTSLAIITVLTKEGAVQAAEFSDDKVTQVMIMIAMGVLATTAVSFLLWPVSARSDLCNDFVEVTDSFGDLLTTVTRSFLSGSEQEMHQPAFQDALRKYKKLYTSLTKNLKEAKNEHYVFGTERQHHLEARLVNCMQKLDQCIGGIRSAANTQFLLLSAVGSGDVEGHGQTQSPPKPSGTPCLSTGTASPTEDYDAFPTFATASQGNSSAASPRLAAANSKSVSSVNNADDIFASFIVQSGSSMKSLAVTLCKILNELPFAKDGSVVVNAHFRSSLSDAIDLYTSSRQESLHSLYKSKEISKDRPPEMQADFEEVAASCGYFSISLLDFAQEMLTYLDILDDLKLEIEERPEGRTWRWLKVWLRFPQQRARLSDPETERFIDQNESDEMSRHVLSSVTRRATDKTVPRGRNRVETWRYYIWRKLGFFRRDDIKFAIKVGFGAALYALPSFLPSTRPIYQHWRGEWGLLSYMLVCSMTLGASNTTGFSRFFGTCLGAVCAILSWIASQGNGPLQAFFGWVMSLWTAYIIVALNKGPMGRFIMLTYNLSALYAYSLSIKDADGDDDEGGVTPIITDITLHRVVAVLSGCLWGLIITRVIWPISARSKFKDGLSLLWLRMSLVWKRDPLNVLIPPTHQSTTEPHRYMDLREEFDLRAFLTRLDKLRSSASSEVDLRGPFPDEAYGRVLEGTGKMLDAFHAMSVMIRKNPRASKGEMEILKCTRDERGQLCSRISHLFQVLASSIKLQYPLNEALPSIDNARDRLLAKIFQFRRKEQEKLGATDEDFELLYAFVLVTGQLSKEIQELEREIEGLFGVLNEDLLKLE